LVGRRRRAGRKISKLFSCLNHPINYLSLMSTEALIIRLNRLRCQMQVCEDFADWEGCERIEEEISSLEAVLEEKNLTEA
jgi:hypothetical protein